MLPTTIMMPSRRPPEKFVTLKRYKPKRWPLVIVSDPDYYTDHQKWVRTQKLDSVSVMKGARGLYAQLEICYQHAARIGHSWFRLDDDLQIPDNLVHWKHGRGGLTLDSLIEDCRKCMDEHGVSLVGPHRTKNQFYLKNGYGRSYCYISGQAQLVKGSSNPYRDGFLDKNLKTMLEEEVYRCLAHRKKDGAIGVVHYAGIDTYLGYDPQDRAIPFDREGWLHDIDYITNKFQGMVTYKWVDEGPEAGQCKFKMLGKGFIRKRRD